MAQLTLKGNPVQTNGELPAIGSTAPNFSLVAADLSEKQLSAYAGKLKVLNIFPSVDTGTCAASLRAFYRHIKNNERVVVLNISKDLPFALGRFCQAEGLENVEALSAFRSSFSDDYGLTFTTGPLMGLCSRAVIVLDAENKLLYHEQVAELTQEPNYTRVQAALAS